MSRGCLNWYSFHKSGFKSTPFVLLVPTMQEFVEDVINVSQYKIPMSGGDATYQWSCYNSSLNSHSYQLSGVSAWPQKSFSAKLSTPKDGGRFILACLTNRNYHVNSISLLGQCFIVVVYDETGLPMLNIHLSYKPPSSCRILLLSGRISRQVSCLKKFRSLVVPGGGFHKGVIIKEILTPRGVLPNGH